MADSKMAQEYPLQAGKGVYNNSTDAFKIYFCSDNFGAIDATQTPFNLSDVTQVGGGNFPIAGISLTSVTWTRSGAVSTLDYADLAKILKNASNPATIKTAVIVNDTSASDDIYKVVDLTGGTDNAINVIANDFDYEVNASGSVTGTVT